MRVFAAFALLTTVTAFCPVVYKTKTKSSTTQLESIDRRHVLVTVAATLVAPLIAEATPLAVHNRKGVSASSTWFFDERIDEVREESQMPTGDKLDLNSAIVTEYMQFRGMYPRAAGLIASNGPYNDVKDIYKIKGLTDNDKKLFKQYEKEFMVNPPGRMFDERINQRQST